ncbi:hypothetical protein HYPSUDRAFT_71439 [Hypholoma sublateritium FD-334 SS-4]|uniref:Uncharacterized protein n=1 Tax=Hypholoma sublateritium (strain FD-334 SS-4) TaxID=945553 RepID=A0A0D2NI35_HYPSF|nr:hypothetical protein HYPSUDRAFT_71439 [Hypholoma sublateritium FD-334 SS-4]
MTRWRENKDKRGAKATKYVFNTEQEKILYEYGWELEQNIGTIAKGRALKNNLHVTAWKKKTATDIISRPEFAALDVSERSLAEWLSGGIVGWFTNYFNRYIAKASTTVDPIQEARSPQSTREWRSTDKLLRRFVIFSGDLSPKEFFARENPDLLRDRMEEILEQRGDKFPHGAARNMALQELWAELTSSDKNEWKDCAQNLAEDVSKNREEFPFVIANALQSMCDRGRLGTVALSLHYAYRNDAGGLECGCVYAGKDVNTGEKLNFKMKDNDKWQEQWRNYTEQIVPMPPPQKATSIKQGDNGTTLFPDMDIKRTSPEQVALVIEEYITALWKKAASANPEDKVRWAAIAKEPKMFYDTKRFKLPCSLKPARELEDNPQQLYPLVEYLRDLQKRGIPFKFYPQNELDTDSSSDEMYYSRTSGVVKKLVVRAVPASVAAATASESTLEETITASSSRPVGQLPTVSVTAATKSLPAAEKLPYANAAASQTTQHQLAVDQPNPAAAHASDAATTKSQPAVEKPPAVVAAASQSVQQVEEPVSATTPASATTSIVPITASSFSEQSAAKVKQLGWPRKAEDAAEASQRAERDPPSDEPVPCGPPAEQPVAKVKQSRKRKRDAPTGPEFDGELSEKGFKSSGAAAAKTEPAKKRLKVKWQRINTGREIPCHETSGWDSANDDALTPDEDEELADDDFETPDQEDVRRSYTTEYRQVFEYRRVFEGQRALKY